MSLRRWLRVDMVFGWADDWRRDQAGRLSMGDAFLFAVILSGSIIMTWGVVGLVFFMIDDVWWGQPHSIRWLPGGWEPSASQRGAGAHQGAGIPAH